LLLRLSGVFQHTLLVRPRGTVAGLAAAWPEI